MPTPIQLHISSPGLANQDLLALRTAVKLLAHSGQAFALEEHYRKSAHLLVVDGETDSGRSMLKNSRSGQVKLLLSSQPKTAKNIIAVQKPVDVSTLKNLLSKLFVVMHKQLLKTTPDDNSTEQAVNSNIENVFDLLLDLKANNRQVVVKTDAFPTLLLDGKNRSVATKGTMDDLAKFVRIPVKSLNVRVPDDASVFANTSQQNISSLDTILWLAAIECSNGKPLPGHDINKPVKLRAWPNFSRNNFRQDHLKLAAMLARSPLTLTELAQFSKVPYADVVDFYNAAFSVDLIEIQENRGQTPEPARKQAGKRLGLLTKIARRLALSG